MAANGAIEDLHANVWTNPGETPGNGIDDDGNGFIDDVHGVNFANSNDDRDNDPMGSAGDALQCRITAQPLRAAASAVADNSVGVAGTAWNADLMHINAGAAEEGDGATFAMATKASLYAAANGADIVNASWGGFWLKPTRRLQDSMMNP